MASLKPPILHVSWGDPYIPKKFHDDYSQATTFLISYKKNNETFNAYRRDIERFSQWCWFFAKLPFKKIERDDIENFLQFCRKPPNHWIGKKNVAKFISEDGKQIPNPVWRPYVVKISKAEHSLGKKPKASKYRLSDSGFKMIFTVLQGFYKFMVLNHYLPTNIIDLIKQKTHYYRKQQGAAKVRRISPLQWEVVMEVAENMANDEPDKHERTLFIMSMLYGLYLRISELAASERWTPMMHHFKKDYEDNWWFRTLGKGNKERTIAVSDAVLAALKRWREHLGTSRVELISLTPYSVLSFIDMRTPTEPCVRFSRTRLFNEAFIKYQCHLIIELNLTLHFIYRLKVLYKQVSSSALHC